MMDLPPSNWIAHMRETYSNAKNKIWASLFERQSTKLEDDILSNISLMFYDAHEFILASPHSNRVLGFECGLCMISWGVCNSIYDILTFDIFRLVGSLLILMIGIFAIIVEYKIVLLAPRGILKFISEEFCFLLKPYSRPMLYMYSSFVIMSRGDFVSILDIESFIFGFAIFILCVYACYNTYRAQHIMIQLLNEHIDVTIISTVFHNQHTNNNGKVATSDLIKFLHITINLSLSELESALLDLDSNHNCEVHLDDFKKWYSNIMTIIVYTNLLRVNVGMPLLYHVPGVI